MHKRSPGLLLVAACVQGPSRTAFSPITPPGCFVSGCSKSGCIYRETPALCLRGLTCPAPPPFLIHLLPPPLHPLPHPHPHLLLHPPSFLYPAHFKLQSFYPYAVLPFVQLACLRLFTAYTAKQLFFILARYFSLDGSPPEACIHPVQVLEAGEHLTVSHSVEWSEKKNIPLL